MTLEEAKELLSTASMPTTKEERDLLLEAMKIVAGSFAAVPE